MKSVKSLVGKRFNYLTVLDKPYIRRGPRQRIYWECQCDCGGFSVVQTSNLTGGKVTSCGCVGAGKTVARNKRGRKENPARHHPLINIYQGMKQRCYNKNDKNYHRYGGRGIIICDRWLQSFWNFVDDMGTRPSLSHSIDRIDVNGNYDPSNCRWADKKEQANNIRIHGITKLKCDYEEALAALNEACWLLDYGSCELTGGVKSLPQRNFVFNTRDKLLPNLKPLSMYNKYGVEWAK